MINAIINNNVHYEWNYVQYNYHKIYVFIKHTLAHELNINKFMCHINYNVKCKHLFSVLQIYTESVQPHFFIFCSKIKKIINIPVKLNFAKDCISSQILLCNKGSKSKKCPVKILLTFLFFIRYD